MGSGLSGPLSPPGWSSSNGSLFQVSLLPLLPPGPSDTIWWSPSGSPSYSYRQVIFLSLLGKTKAGGPWGPLMPVPKEQFLGAQWNHNLSLEFRAEEKSPPLSSFWKEWLPWGKALGCHKQDCQTETHLFISQSPKCLWFLKKNHGLCTTCQSCHLLLS